MFAKITYGAFGSFLLKMAIIINNFGLVCAYFKIFGDVFSSLIGMFIKDETSMFKDQLPYILVLFVIMFPFIFQDSIESLKVFIFC